MRKKGYEREREKTEVLVFGLKFKGGFKFKA